MGKAYRGRVLDEDTMATTLLAIARFSEIYETEGPEAAAAWAERETAKIEGREAPDLKIVSK